MATEKTADRASYKSEDIVDQLLAVQLAVQKFEELVEKIEGSGSAMCDEKGEDLNDRCLSSLLDIMPEILDGFASTIHRTTNNLESALY